MLFRETGHGAPRWSSARHDFSLPGPPPARRA
jgi:hypothetical protein